MGKVKDIIEEVLLQYIFMYISSYLVIFLSRQAMGTLQSGTSVFNLTVHKISNKFVTKFDLTSDVKSRDKLIILQT